MIDKYVGREIEIIYLDRKGKFTQRTIHVISIKCGKVKAICSVRNSIRIFNIENILACTPKDTKRYGYTTQYGGLR
jgi:predicted DNA-binding transcriptional regulator YafY